MKLGRVVVEKLEGKGVGLRFVGGVIVMVK